MSEAFSPEIAVRDLRLAFHASGTQPAWLWSSDDTRILWTNAAGAAALDLRGRPAFDGTLGPADPRRRQIAQLAGRLPRSGAARLERMRGFGAPLGCLTTCSCAWLMLENGASAILIASLVNTARPLPLVERLQFLLDRLDDPAMALAADGTLLAANKAARDRHDVITELNSPAFAQARTEALQQGRAAAASTATRFALFRTGSGHEISIVALMTPTGASAEPSVAPHDAASLRENAAPPAEAEPLDETFADEVLVDADVAEDGTVSAGDPNPVPTPPVTTPVAGAPRAVVPGIDEPDALSVQATHPLRFLWQMDAQGRFSLGSDDFVKLIGPLAAAALGRPWSEIAELFGLDPDGRVADAIAGRQTWSGITVNWPVTEHGEHVPIELSGLPMFDRAGNFAGYRGFGVCRDVSGLERLAELRRQESRFGAMHPQPAPARRVEQDARAGDPPATHDSGHQAAEKRGDGGLAPPVVDEPPQNVVPFRAPGDARAPGLSAVENHAFDEIARRLSARLEDDGDDDAGTPGGGELGTALPHRAAADEVAAISLDHGAGDAAAWLSTAGEETRGDSVKDKPLLDRIPSGILIYRLDRLLYANPAFLERTGFASLAALSEAGGLDALYVQPMEPQASSNSESGMPLSIATAEHSDAATPARLYTISWDGESAMALIFSGEPATAPVASPVLREAAIAETAAAQPPDDSLASIIEATPDGIVMLDGEGNVLSCNRSAAQIFGRSSEQLKDRHFADLFAGESQPGALAYLRSIDDPAIAVDDHGHELLGRSADGTLIPLSMTMGRTGSDGRLFAVFRDLSERRESEAALADARRNADAAAASTAGVLAKIDHEIRVPLNAIIGFAEAMLEQRLGPLGNDRYLGYIGDIRAAGERVLAIVGDMLDLTRIENGRLELSPASVSLNEIVAQCVATLQPQANRERVVIRSSLAHHLPVVVVDPRSLRQIATNLIASSIHLAELGGQVIVSTALTDEGHVALRVRDTGKGLSDGDLAAAVEPYRPSATGVRAVPDTSSLNLSLTKALAEANRAHFGIRKAAQAGTLIEVIFRRAEPAAAGG